MWEVTGWPSVLAAMGHIPRNVLQGLNRPERNSTPASHVTHSCFLSVHPEWRQNGMNVPNKKDSG